MSEKAALACTDAVETEIDKHYSEQLPQLGDDDPELAADIADFQADELEHRDTARASRRCAGRRISPADCGDPCRLQGGDRAFEANLRNERRLQPLESLVERTRLHEQADDHVAGRRPCAGGLAACPDRRARASRPRQDRSSTAMIPARARTSASAHRRASDIGLPKSQNPQGTRQQRQSWAQEVASS